jgi:hypothetical protein
MLVNVPNNSSFDDQSCTGYSAIGQKVLITSGAIELFIDAQCEEETSDLLHNFKLKRTEGLEKVGDKSVYNWSDKIKFQNAEQ